MSDYGEEINIKTAEDFENAKKKQQHDPSKPIVTNLIVFNSFATDETVSKIVEAFPHLLRLGLGRCEKITDASLVFISKLTSLQELLLSFTKITDVGLPHLAKLTQLRTVSLGGTRVTDAGLPHLSTLTSLQVLSLCASKVTDAGLPHLSKLTSLQRLYLHETQVTDAGLPHLSKLTSLQTLFLNETKVTDAGLPHLSKLIQLQQLRLNNTDVTDAGLPHLSKLTSLQTLGLLVLEVTDAGLLHLANLPFLDPEKVETPAFVTKEGKEAFKKQLRENQAKQKANPPPSKPAETSTPQNQQQETPATPSTTTSSTPQQTTIINDFTPILQQINQEAGTSLTLADVSTELKNATAIILKTVNKNNSNNSNVDLLKLYKDSAWLLALVASHKFEISEADIKVLFDNNFDLKKFLKLDRAKMEELKLSATSRFILEKVIAVEKMRDIRNLVKIVPRKNVVLGTQLGFGATCDVYESVLDYSDVAAKIFKPTFTEEKRFQNEIRTSALIRHDNVAAIRAVIVDDRDEDKIVGILMEKLSKENLGDKIKQKTHDVKQRLLWCFEAARGIAAAHGQNIIHSDIKPDNILISKHNEAKLTDFGCSFAVSSTVTSGVSATRGTLLFTAPEYSNPDLLESDYPDCGFKIVPNTSTDVFAFGMTLWCVFHPDCDHGLGKNDAGVVLNIQMGKKPKFSATDMPPEVKSLIEKCLSRNPKERPQVSEIVDVLGQLTK